MPALPIVERELRVAARNRVIHWSRAGVVLLLGLLWIPGWAGTFGTTTEINTFVFNGMLWAAFGVSCFACLFTADAISRERREGTLGLLFLSRVRAMDVLLGKLGSSGFVGLCMLAAFLPMLMIPVLAGGVTGGEAAREGLVLLNTFWFSLCVGLWASARSEEAFKSIRNACLTVGVIVLIPFFYFTLYSFMRPVTWPIGLGLSNEPLLERIELSSPLMTLSCGRDALYKLSPSPYWISLVLVQVLGWLLLLFAGVRLRRSLREPDTAIASIGCVSALHPKENPPSLASNRRGKKRIRFLRAYSNPIDWFVQRQRGIRTALWIAAAIEVLYFASSWAVFRGMFTLGWPAVIGWVIWFFASASTDALFARAGSKFFYDAKRTGQLEMLLTTPLGPRGVVDGQWSALKKMLAWPVAIGLGAMLLDEDILLVTQIGQPGGYSFGWVAQCFVTWSIDITSGILGVLAGCWLGMIFALKGKNALGIMARAAGLCTAVPALFKALFAYGAERITFTVSANGFWPGTIANWLEEFIIIAYYFWLFRWAKNHVFRELSGAQPASKKSSHASRITHPAPSYVTDVTL
jgi:hypothetical protein